MENLYIKLLIASGALLALGISWMVLFSNTYGRTGMNKLRGSFLSRITTTIVKSFVPAKGSKRALRIRNWLGRMNSHLTIESFYSLKLSFSIVFFLVSFLVILSNIELERDMIISGSQHEISQQSIVGDSSVPLITTNKTVSQKQLESITRMISQNINSSYLKTLPIDQATNEISNLITLNTQLDPKIVPEVSKAVYYRIIELDDVTNSRRFLISMLFLLIGYFTPEAILYLMVKMRERAYESEAYNLETTLILLGGISTTTVSYIIEVLTYTSKLFRPFLTEFEHRYSANSTAAYAYASENGVHPSMLKIIDTLRKSETSDRKTAIESLENRRTSKKEFNRMRINDKLELKNLIALVAYFGVFVLVMQLFFQPWLFSFDFNNFSTLMQ